jgi:hypothetical protein
LPSLNFPPSFGGKIKVGRWSLLRLLHETVQQHHLAPDYAEDDSRRALISKVAAYFPQAPRQRAAVRHSDRPAKLDFLNVSSDHFPVITTERQQPFPDWPPPA